MKDLSLYEVVLKTVEKTNEMVDKINADDKVLTHLIGQFTEVIGEGTVLQRELQESIAAGETALDNLQSVIDNSQIGVLANLTTADKSTLVGARRKQTG